MLSTSTHTPTLLFTPHTHTAFRTDTDISAHKTHPRERDLQAWVPASTDPSAPLDEDTFSLGLGGPNANGTTSWDQFTVNEQLFGVKGSFDENVYTTKLDRSAPDFKEREKRAMRIASEIMGVSVGGDFWDVLLI